MLDRRQKEVERQHFELNTKTNPIYTHSIDTGHLARQKRCAAQLNGEVLSGCLAGEKKKKKPVNFRQIIFRTFQSYLTVLQLSGITGIDGVIDFVVATQLIRVRPQPVQFAAFQH
jgi:hypothetical protein